MRFFCFTLLFVVICGDDFEKYRSVRERCQRSPADPDCLKMQNNLLQLVQKCEKINAKELNLVCQQVKDRLCAVFPSNCLQTTTTTTTTKKISSTTPRKITKAKIIRTTTVESKLITVSTLGNEEFVKVPVNPEELRTRGEYCIRHGKEKKCQELLNNLKTAYSTCGKNKNEETPTKPEEIDCHSFQTHLCQAFPKFPPCIKKKSPKTN